MKHYLLFFCCLGAFTFNTLSQVPVHTDLRGKVSESGGKGIVAVGVTDGTNIVYTDSNGNYSLAASWDATFVYIIVPAGYEIPMKNGLVHFYRRISAVKGLFTANFLLKKMIHSDTNHFTIVWADPQINNKSDAAQLLSGAVIDTRLHALDLMKKGPVVGIAAGDLSWDAPDIIPEYKEAIRQTGIPFFQVLGNHDMDINVRSDELSGRTFQKNMGPSCYAFQRGKAHYIVLDNVFYYGDSYNYMGYITEKEFHWVEQYLSRVRPGSIVFVSMHIPLYNNEKTRMQLKEDNPGNVTVNRRYLYDLLKPFNAHILTGHTHSNENVITGNIYEHIHAAICGSWWLTPLCTDGTPAGYGVYVIKGDSLSWYYKSIGKPVNYQMRVYNRGDYQNHRQDIAVNVWNWDKKWEVKWFEDGVLQGSMKQATEMDQDAKAFLTGPDRPARSLWAQPVLTDHLFFATPSLKARLVRIEVTDRFGNRYEENFKLKKGGVKT